MKAIVFDTETTGLIPNRKMKLDLLPEVIEFYGAVVDLNNGDISEEIELLIRPNLTGTKLPDIIEKITGLNYEKDLQDKPQFMTVHNQIQEFMLKADTVIAHNIGYDVDMIEIEFERLGVEFKWPERKICTIEQAMGIKGYRLNLQKLYQALFSEGFEGAHRAKEDVKALIRCCVELNSRGFF